MFPMTKWVCQCLIIWYVEMQGSLSLSYHCRSCVYRAERIEDWSRLPCASCQHHNLPMLPLSCCVSEENYIYHGTTSELSSDKESYIFPTTPSGKSSQKDGSFQGCLLLSGDDGKDKILIGHKCPGTSRGITVTTHFKEIQGLSSKDIILISVHM